jgi:sugar/nucleoside kinase (ribokinase family)
VLQRPWIDAIPFANAASAVSVSQPGLTLPDHATVVQSQAEWAERRA